MNETFTLLYFAATRDAIGRASETVPVAALDAPNVASLWRWLHERYPQTSSWPGHVKVAIAHDFASDESPIAAGDEVALLPPASGGSGEPSHADVSERDGWLLVTRSALEPDALDALVQRPDAGAVVCFTGRVRDHTGGREVSYLEYDAYPSMALAKLAQAVDEATERWPATRSAIHHRWGRLEIGEAAVVVATSSPHRAEAFAACQYIIDRLKQIVPIWKKEISPTGDEWVGFGP